MIARRENNEEVRELINKWREDNFNPTWRLIAKEVDLDYSYIISWKNSERNMGPDALASVVKFVEENS